VARGAADAREESLTGGYIGKVQRDALEAANGFLSAKHALFFFEDGGKIHLDPTQRLRKRHAIGARIESCGEVEHRVRAFFDGREDGAVEEMGAKRLRPLPAGARHLAMNVLATLAGESARKRIAKKRVGTIGFHGAMEGSPARRVRNVANERFFRRSRVRHRAQFPTAQFTVRLVHYVSLCKHSLGEPSRSEP
jgi:hypothetical protein